MNLAQCILAFLLRVYRVAISPVLNGFLNQFGFGCRYMPTCSQFALEAVCTHGAGRGSWLAARRLCRCHPWGGSGWEPVPERTQGRNPEPERTRTLNVQIRTSELPLTSDLLP